MHYKEKALIEGRSFETSEKGNSMTPLIRTKAYLESRES